MAARRLIYSFSKIAQKYSTTSRSKINEIPTNDGNLALVSLSNDVYYNLALEQYIADNYDFNKRNILFLWRNEPCVVLGRYQNAWYEANLVEMKNRNVKLSRRPSGGGTVYHDMGNLNCTFFTNRLKYNRNENLKVLKATLDKLLPNRNFEITPRFDLVLIENQADVYKISGTSSRLAKNYSYHHCTLLLDADMANMDLLKPGLIDFISENKGTKSVRAKCKNLLEIDSNLKLNSLIERLAQEYWRLNWSNWSINTLFNYIDPTDQSIEHLIRSYHNDLTKWEFIYGSSPKFQLKCNLNDDGAYLVFHIENGTIVNIDSVNLDFNQLDSLTQYAYLFHGKALVLNDLNKIFIDYNLLNMKMFAVVYEFFNKHMI